MNDLIYWTVPEGYRIRAVSDAGEAWIVEKFNMGHTFNVRYEDLPDVVLSAQAEGLVIV